MCRPLPVHSPVLMLAFVLLGSAVLGALGVVAGVTAEKFDQLGAFQNFVIMPLSFLSGVFYSIHSLPDFWQKLSRFNPFFYAIDGVRYGFIGRSDSELWLSMTVMVAINAALFALVYRLFATGYKLKS